MRTFLLTMTTAIVLSMASAAPLSAAPAHYGSYSSASAAHHRPGPAPKPSHTKEYQRLMRKADDCRRKADHYRRQAREKYNQAEKYSYQARQYAHRHQYGHARSAQQRADRAMHRYRELMRQADTYDRRATDYERQARRLPPPGHHWEHR